MEQIKSKLLAAIQEFLAAQAVSKVPVRYTLPGPMTMMDGCYNAHYSDSNHLAADLVVILQREVLALAAHGCRHIQLDEPVLMRYPKQALETGVANIAAVFRGCPAQVERAVHLCCGYPDRLEPTDYHKADPANYPAILQALDQAGMDWVGCCLHNALLQLLTSESLPCYVRCRCGKDGENLKNIKSLGFI